MAVFKSPLGEVKGKYGNLITYVVKGQNRVRSKPLVYHDANTPGQQIARQRIKFLSLFYSRTMYSPLLQAVWKAAAIPTPHDRYVLFRKVNANVCMGDYTIADYSRVHLATGELPPAMNMRMEVDCDGRVVLAWENHLACFDSRAEDTLRVAYLKDGDFLPWIVSGISAKRKDEQAVFYLENKKGIPLHVYVFFASPAEDLFSDDTYFRVEPTR